MSPVILVLSATVIAQPPAGLVAPAAVSLPTMPEPVRDRVRSLAGVPPPGFSWNVTFNQNGIYDRAAAGLHRSERAEIERELAARPSDMPTLRRAIWYSDKLGESARADDLRDRLVRVLAKQTDADPADASVRVALADILRERNRHAEAVAVARDAVRLAPRSAAAWRVLGRARTDAGEWDDEVFAAFDTAIDLDPQDWRTPAARADARLLWLNRRKPEKARAMAELSACELDRQTAVRLGGQEPECIRWAAGVAQNATLVGSQVDPAGAARRMMDVLLPAIVQMADLEPADARAVLIATTCEVMGRSKTGDLLPATPDRPTTFSRFPPDARARHDRWLRRVSKAVADDRSADAAERAVVAARLFSMHRRFDWAVAAGRRAVELQPDEPLCEDVLRSVLLAAPGRAEEALARGRTWLKAHDSAADRLFVVQCLQALDRWADAETEARAGATAYSDDLRLTLAIIGCQLHSGTAEAVTAGGGRLDTVWAKVQERPADDGVRKETAKLVVIHRILSDRYTEADSLLGACQSAGHPVADHDELVKAARPVLWPTAVQTGGTAKPVAGPVVIPAAVGK